MLESILRTCKGYPARVIVSNWSVWLWVSGKANGCSLAGLLAKRGCLHMAMGLASCGFLDSARQSAATTLSRRVRGILSRGPKERSRVSLMSWGK